MRELRGRVAAVTGAGSGIGRALAIRLAEEGCHVALADIDGERLAEAASVAGHRGVEVSTRVLDVADRDAVHAWADEAAGVHGGVNIVVNNAGVGLGATVDGMAYEDLDWLMGVNFWGVVHGTKAFLPHLEASGEGHVVNVSSVFGLVGVPSQSAYNAAKFAVRGFTEALRVELDIRRCGVSSTAVHPGGIATNIAQDARMSDSIRELGMDPGGTGAEFEKLLRTSPERAAEVIVRGIRRNRRRVLIGTDARLFALLGKLPAGVHQPLLAAGVRLGSTAAARDATEPADG